MPTADVIIPTFNRRVYVQEAIDSALAQTYADREIVVVDDGSTDGTGDALRSRYGDRIRYLWQANQGESASRNRGIEESCGEYVAFLDSDDLWLPQKLERQVALLESSPDVGMAFCQAWQIDGRGERMDRPPVDEGVAERDLDFESMVLGNRIGSGGSTAVIRRSVLRQTGGFEPRLRYGEDWDLWLRVTRITQVRCLPEPLACVRIHRGGQFRFPMPEVVDDVLHDHLLLLERAFSTGPSREALRRQALALEHARAAWLHYAFGDVRAGQERLASAASLAPRIWCDVPQLAQRVVSAALQMHAAFPGDDGAPVRFVENVCRGLPDPLDRLAERRRKLIGCVEMDIGHDLYRRGEWRRARRHMVRGIAADPTWLRNRGMLVRLVEMSLGARMAELARRLWHAATQPGAGP